MGTASKLGIGSDDNACCNMPWRSRPKCSSSNIGYRVFGSCARQHFCLFSLRCSPENTSHRTSIQTLFCILSSPPCSLSQGPITHSRYTQSFKKHWNTQKPTYARRQLVGLAHFCKALQTSSIGHLGNRRRSHSNILTNRPIPLRAQSG